MGIDHYRDKERRRAQEREREKRRPKRHRHRHRTLELRAWRDAHPNYHAEWLAAHPGYMKEYRARFPERERARQKLNRERRAGRVTKLDCEVCGSMLRVEGHHAFGYSEEMALAVWWLCKTHHEAMHSAVHWASRG